MVDPVGGSSWSSKVAAARPAGSPRQRLCKAVALRFWLSLTFSTAVEADPLQCRDATQICGHLALANLLACIDEAQTVDFR